MTSFDCPRCQWRFSVRTATLEKQYRCRTPGCGARMVFDYRRDDKPAFNHVPHVVLSVVSCGFYAPVYLLLVVLHAVQPDPTNVYCRVIN